MRGGGVAIPAAAGALAWARAGSPSPRTPPPARSRRPPEEASSCWWSAARGCSSPRSRPLVRDFDAATPATSSVSARWSGPTSGSRCTHRAARPSTRAFERFSGLARGPIRPVRAMYLDELRAAGATEGRSPRRTGPGRRARRWVPTSSWSDRAKASSEGRAAGPPGAGARLQGLGQADPDRGLGREVHVLDFKTWPRAADGQETATGFAPS